MSQTEAPMQQLRADLRDWGGPAEMSAFDAVMWRAEADPRLRSTVTSVMVLDRTPDWAQLMARHRWLVDAAPRFRQRVVVPALNTGHPTWVDDPHFDLAYHVRRIGIAEPGSRRQLFELAQTLAMTPFDRSRPPWEATLIEGLENGRAAYVLKLHHAVSDGLGIIQLLTRMLSRTRDDTERAQSELRARSRRAAPSALSLSLRQLRKRLRTLPQDGAEGLSTARRHLRSALNDPATLTSYLASAKRTLGVRPVPGSPIFRRRSLSWHFEGIEIPLPRLKAAARQAGASLNDALLAGLIGGFRRYHEEMGLEQSHMPLSFPVSLRTGDDTLGTNRFAGVQYAAPLLETDALKRIHAIQEFVRGVRQEPALDLLVRMMPAITRLPLPAITAMIAGFTVAQDAQISNVPGIPHQVFLAGAEVVEFWPFPPLPGCGMMIALVSHSGRCFLGINSDSAAVTEPDLLAECFRLGVEEVLLLAPAAKKSANARKRTAKS
ncbi:wax ester/triacylglycerol synthase family O-acyltransferase [Solimonas terrae]|uniref:diacylglycerol O-acyltransferase n=1 Tax=Solimonas terrae TaxID=1396819 RepID=A0A6M2BY85_9GAMM|nr:wax ester/triacylglycerol synthase family O-acyltransferase [Solimonas terrae]NGY06777.1 wax ester/triacylglycerol synthase family O-acyltransferase [Solimonas terrae]